MAWITTALSMDFSRATASAICSSSSRLAATPMAMSVCSLMVPALGGIEFSMRSLGVAGFPRFQTFLDQSVGQNELCISDVGERQTHPLGAALTGDVHEHVMGIDS